MSDMNQLFASLEDILTGMNEIAAELEEVIFQERQAVRELDAEKLVELSEQRSLLHKLMGEMELQCRALLSEGGAPESMRVETFIDLYAGSSASSFQALRRELYERLSRVDRDNTDNYVRMHAAYDVTHAVLQQIGVIESRQTYGRREAR